MPGRVALIGDLAGHRDELVTELARLGADADGVLPLDLTVVQVGDLVHRGPDSDGVVALVDRYLTGRPGQWVQLVGNHEAQYLRPPAFEWPEHVGAATVESLRRWWSAGAMRPAAVVDTPGETFLVTHAGLTAGYWRAALAAPASARDAARALNSFAGTQEDALFRPGRMLLGGRPDELAGPIWADAATELVAGWRETRLPFSQVHGHAMVADWARAVLRGDDPSLAELVTVDVAAKHETVALPGGRIVGIDPGHGRAARRPWRAFVLDAATVSDGR